MTESSLTIDGLTADLAKVKEELRAARANNDAQTSDAIGLAVARAERAESALAACEQRLAKADAVIAWERGHYKEFTAIVLKPYRSSPDEITPDISRRLTDEAIARHRSRQGGPSDAKE